MPPKVGERTESLSFSLRSSCAGCHHDAPLDVAGLALSVAAAEVRGGIRTTRPGARLASGARFPLLYCVCGGGEA